MPSFRSLRRPVPTVSGRVRAVVLGVLVALSSVSLVGAVGLGATAGLGVGAAMTGGPHVADDNVAAIVEFEPAADHVRGTVASLGVGSFVVRLKDDSLRTVTYDATTTFHVDKSVVTSAALAVGLGVNARGTATAASLTAAVVRLKLAKIGGKVTATSGSTITIQRGHRPAVTIHVTALTTYAQPGAASPGLTNIVVGGRVKAQGTWNADGSLNASSVRIQGAKDGSAKPAKAGKPAKAPKN